MALTLIFQTINKLSNIDFFSNRVTDNKQIYKIEYIINITKNLLIVTKL